MHGQFYIDELKQPEPFIAILNIASCLYEVCTEDQAQEMAKKLGEVLYQLYMSMCDCEKNTTFSTCRLYSANF